MTFVFFAGTAGGGGPWAVPACTRGWFLVPPARPRFWKGGSEVWGGIPGAAVERLLTPDAARAVAVLPVYVFEVVRDGGGVCGM